MIQYVVIGATGKTGRIVVEDLLRAGRRVRAFARSRDNLEKLQAIGAETFAGDVQDAESLKRAFSGVDAAYIMIPPNFGTADFRKYQDAVTDNLADALAATGVKHAVSLSSVGANHASGVGPVNGLHYLEKQLDGIPDLNTLHLRAGFFMENIFGSLGLIKHKGIYGTASSPDTPWPLILSSDVGHYAAKRLNALNFSGKGVQYLLGSRDISGAQTAEVLAHALGLPKLPYVQFSIEDMRNGLIGAGISEQIASLFCELYEGFNNGLFDYHRDAETTTPGKLEDFATQTVKPAFDAME